MNTRSISFRLLTWYAVWLTVIFVLLGALFYFSLQRFLAKNLLATQMRRADLIASMLIAQIPKDGETRIAGEIKLMYAPEVNDRFIRVTRADGTVVYVSGRPTDNSFNPAEVSVQTAGARKRFSRKIKLSGEKTLLIAAVNSPLPNGSNRGAKYLVEVGALLDPVETMLDRLFLQLALGLPVAVVIITVGGYVLVRRALKPVAQITNAAEHITQHNSSDRLPVAQTGDELQKLSVALNRMIARLDDAFQNSRRFVADASHELRTPLTILHGELEALAEDENTSAEWREHFGSMLEEVARLTKIVEQLFTLSRLDAGESQTEWAAFDLADLVQTTADQMSLLAEDKNIALKCDAAQPVQIAGDRARLKQVIVNLLDNAIKYTPPNGNILIRVKNGGSTAVLEVEDNGIGIPREALPHVFERFFRVDTARSADAGSAGLGLSIVKSICTAHGAEVEAISVPATGSCFRVKFPLP